MSSELNELGLIRMRLGRIVDQLGWALLWLFFIFCNTCSHNHKVSRVNLESTNIELRVLRDEIRGLRRDLTEKDSDTIFDVSPSGHHRAKYPRKED